MTFELESSFVLLRFIVKCSSSKISDIFKRNLYFDILFDSKQKIAQFWGLKYKTVDVEHNDTQHKGLTCDTQYSVTRLGEILLLGYFILEHFQLNNMFQSMAFCTYFNIESSFGLSILSFDILATVLATIQNIRRILAQLSSHSALR